MMVVARSESPENYFVFLRMPVRCYDVKKRRGMIPSPLWGKAQSEGENQPIPVTVMMVVARSESPENYFCLPENARALL
ncbi:hypothetical protein [Klebsiella spallanzanii]|uniref:hypothetical protein n=1 Tax=Klebsiella spallanzanii TaxID=2587528 RepID=UPI00115A618B|nr:hypothetical protein [Klebsiella spallanzanii]VUT02069.1 hypothetical protein SB6419_01692 [Klebsiella spallanzanii]